METKPMAKHQVNLKATASKNKELKKKEKRKIPMMKKKI